jgi:ATP-binding cassette subfamily F protein 3
MIQLSGLGKRYAHKLLFEGLDWLITPQERVGLVGGNGTGKSTLLKILAGIEDYDYGDIARTKQMTTGYLPQDGLHLEGRTVFEECMTVFAALKAMEAEMLELTKRMGEVSPSSEEYREIADRYAIVEHELRNRDVYSLDAQIGSVLSGLGFTPEDWQRDTGEFSGGWQMRLSLAKLLLQQPDLLLLDEPTNHLDLETRNWLEGYLANYPGAYIVISHDRYFLDVTVNKIVEIWNKKVQFYVGNYDKYLREKDQRRDSLMSAYKNQRDRIEQLEAFISRFRYQATKAKQVQSRIKELEKIERIEVPSEEKTIHFTFPQPKPSGRIVAEFTGAGKSYGDKHVLANVSGIVERGDRIALVGVNGAGKSTFIKLLTGIEPLSAGEMRLGHNVEIDYFAQDQYKELNATRRVIDDLGDVSPSSTETELRSILGSFLFSADDVFKPIGVLSGGERNRYALARMLMQPSNFLLLDEPTNHLDLRAKDVLLEALEKFTGTVVFVSHDRYFVDNLATRIFEVAGGTVTDFHGNYEEYLRSKANGGTAPVILDVPTQQAVQVQESATPSVPRKRVNPLKLKQMTERCGELERLIAENETAIAAHETALTQFVSAEETQRLCRELEERKSALSRQMSEWEQLSAELEECQ